MNMINLSELIRRTLSKNRR